MLSYGFLLAVGEHKIARRKNKRGRQAELQIVRRLFGGNRRSFEIRSNLDICRAPFGKWQRENSSTLCYTSSARSGCDKIWSMTDIDLVVKAITETLKPKKIILFGSHVRGDNDKNSDFDLAVLQLKTPKIGQRALVFRKLWSMGYDWKREPDIHIFSEKSFNDRLKNNSFFIRQIIKGKTIYAI